MPPAGWIAAAGAAWVAVSSIVAWGYATGRLVGSAPTKQDLEQLKALIDREQSGAHRHLADGLNRIEQQVDQNVVAIGRLQRNEIRLDGRMRAVERVSSIPSNGGLEV